MRHLAIVAVGALLIAAGGSAGAGSLSPAGLSPAAPSPVEFVQERRQSDTLTKRVKRAWKDLVGYKFNVSCPIIFPINHRTCTETGKDRAEARAKCRSQNAFCYVSSADAG